MGVGDGSRVTTRRVSNQTSETATGGLGREEQERPAIAGAASPLPRPRGPSDPQEDMAVRGPRLRCHQPWPERGLRQAAGTGSVESQRKEMCFHGGQVETSVRFWLQPPHFSDEKANSEGTPARGPAAPERSGGRGCRASEAQCCGPQARRVTSLGTEGTGHPPRAAAWIA